MVVVEDEHVGQGDRGGKKKDHRSRKKQQTIFPTNSSKKKMDAEGEDDIESDIHNDRRNDCDKNVVRSSRENERSRILGISKESSSSSLVSTSSFPGSSTLHLRRPAVSSLSTSGSSSSKSLKSVVVASSQQILQRASSGKGAKILGVGDPSLSYGKLIDENEPVLEEDVDWGGGEVSAVVGDTGWGLSDDGDGGVLRAGLQQRKTKKMEQDTGSFSLSAVRCTSFLFLS